MREILPTREEIAHPSRYLRALSLHRKLAKGGYTMTTTRRGRTLHRLAADVAARRVPGDMVDCGVWNGGSTVLLSAGAPGRDVWAFDSFEGLPEPGPLDGVESQGFQGECHGAEELLREAISRFAHPERLRVQRGWFDETFPEAAPEIEAVSLLHCDGDWYESVKLTLETFYPKLSSGGYVVIDDYGHWIGARRATDEFREHHKIDAPLIRIDYTGHYWQKP